MSYYLLQLGSLYMYSIPLSIDEMYGVRDLSGILLRRIHVDDQKVRIDLSSPNGEAGSTYQLIMDVERDRLVLDHRSSVEPRIHLKSISRDEAYERAEIIKERSAIIELVSTGTREDF